MAYVPFNGISEEMLQEARRKETEGAEKAFDDTMLQADGVNMKAFKVVYDDLATAASDYATGAVQGWNEMMREGDALAEQSPLALSGTPMKEGATNAPAPEQTAEQQDLADTYQRSVDNFTQETVQFPAMTVAAILAPEVAAPAMTGYMAYEGYQETGTAAGAARAATYGPLADWASQPDLEDKLAKRPVTTALSGLLGLGQLVAPAAMTLKAAAGLRGKARMGEENISKAERSQSEDAPFKTAVENETPDAFAEKAAHSDNVPESVELAESRTAPRTLEEAASEEPAAIRTSESSAEQVSRDAVTSENAPAAAYSPQPGEQGYLPGQSVQVSGTYDRPVTRQEITQGINKLIAARTGKIGSSSTEGIFKNERDVIRSRNFGDFDVYAHEIGHYIDKQFGLGGYDGELIAKADALWRDNPTYQRYTPEQRRAEGIAEFTRQYLLNPAEAQKSFPGYYQTFTDALAADPRLSRALDSIGSKLRAWYAQTPEARGRGSITFGNEDSKSIMEKGKDLFYRVYEAAFDDKTGLGRLTAAIEKVTGKELEYERNPYKRARMAQNSATARAEMLVTDEDPAAVTTTLNRVYGGKLTHEVTIKSILDSIKDLSAVYPEYLQQGNFKSWNQALSTLLTAKRQVELTRINTTDLIPAAEEASSKALQNLSAATDAYLAAKNASESSGKFTKQVAVDQAEAQLRKAQQEVTETTRELEEARSRQYKTPMSDEDAAAIISKAPPEMEAATQQFYNYHDNLLAIAEEGGLLSSDTVAALRDKYKNYSPMFRDFSDEEAMSTGLGNGKKLGNISNPLKSLSEQGSTRDVIDPLEATVKNTFTLLSAVERNKVAQVFVDLNDTIKDIGRFIEEVPGGTGDASKSIFTVMVNGEKKAFQTEPEFYRAIMAMNAQSSNMLIKFFAPFAKALRTGATIAPDFMIRNMIRDTLTAGIYSETGFRPVLDTAKGAASLLTDKALAYEFKASGAPLSALVGLDRPAVAAYINEISGTGWRSMPLVKAALSVYNGMRKASELSESATRMGEFARARAQGLGIDEAGLLAKDITIDFSRAGTVSRQVNQAVPFFNAVLQGGDRFARAMYTDPVKTALRASLFITLPSIALWVANHDEDWYKEIPEDVKNASWLIKTGDTITRIPKPFEPGIFFGSAPERVLDQLAGQDPDAMKQWAKYAAAGFAPGVMPTLVGPILEWVTNYSMFRQKPIVGPREDKLPDEYQATPFTSEAAKSAGELLGLSPMKIDNTISGYTGGAGSFLVGLFDGILADKNNPAKTPTELPGIRNLTYTPLKNPRSVEEFYERLDTVTKEQNAKGKGASKSDEYRAMNKASEAIRDLQKKNREITADPAMDPGSKRAQIDSNNQRILSIAKKALGR